MPSGSFTGSRVVVRDDEHAEEVHDEHYYGKYNDDVLELSMVEAYHLIDRDLIEVENDGEKLSKDEAFELFTSKDEEFYHKYQAYSDLRERGFIVKTGFKFGAHFRVYPRGVNPYQEGPKKQKQHTKWVVHAVPENDTLSFQEMSRAVRLANNIRATMLWAVVDNESGVTYYEVDRLTP
ncbi:tRNA-intron lyase [Candidatus Nanosalina sp. VS9-1]|uniref:tRNA-intron lyase n=1 Tax=Candidatus Nanosalina sp. VS9-1 TaxID=3388566 RepID=UPI0039DF4DF5